MPSRSSGGDHAKRSLAYLAAVLLVVSAPAPAGAAEDPTSIEVSGCGSDSNLGDHLQLGVRLVDAQGAQVGNQRLELQRDDEFADPVSVATARTDSVDWSTFDDAPPNRGTVTYTVRFDGSNNLAPANATCIHQVIGTGTAIGVTDDAPGVQDQPLVVRGHLTSQGSGLAGKTLEASHNGTPLDPVTTDAEGSFRVVIAPPVAAGNHTVTVRYAGDHVLEDSAATVVRRVRQATVMTITGPDRLPSAGWADFTATLKTVSGEPVPNVWVDAEGDADWGYTDAHGEVRWKKYVFSRDPLRMQAEFSPRPGDPDEQPFAPATASRLWKGIPAYSWWASQRTYVAGQTGTFRVGLHYTSTYPLPDATVTYTPYASTPQTIPAPSTNLDPHSFTRTLTRNAAVRISTPATAWYEAGSRTFSIPVAPRLIQTVDGEYGRDGSTYLVRRWVDPTFRLTTGLNRAGGCAYARTQRYSDGSWRAVLRTSCRRLDSAARTSWRLTGDFPAGALYRVRWETSSDAMNIAGIGAWQVVRFTR